jgi:hypothetical protein
LRCFLYFLLFVATAQCLSQCCILHLDKERVGCLLFAAIDVFDQGCGAEEEASFMEGAAELNHIGYA